MKKAVFPFLTVFVMVFTVHLNATLCTAIADGAWSSAATWSCGHVPGNNDTMWIPVGFTVTVDINTPTYSNMQVIVDGTMLFGNGNKLNLCPGSVYISPTGAMGSGTPGSKLNICGTTMWNGPDMVYGALSFGSVVLPVELISYSGALQTDGTALISWSTATETNNSHFTIERSTNGLTFEEIGRVAGHGTSSQVLSYSYVDANPGSGANYYRLKQTDYNGHYEYKGVVVVEKITNSAGCVLSVFPNPCQGMCTVNFSDCPDDNEGIISLQIIDANGQVVSEQVPERNTDGGFTAVINENNNMKPGIYIVRGVSSENEYTQRVILK